MSKNVSPGIKGAFIGVILAVCAMIVGDYADQLRVKRADYETWQTTVSMSFDEHIIPTTFITNATYTVHWFPDLTTLQAFLDDRHVLGQSNCEFYPQKNYSHCDLYVVLPKYVDDEWVNTIGHEVLHGLLGDYHRH